MNMCKKLLSALLAVTLLAALSVTGHGAETSDGTDDGKTLYASVLDALDESAALPEDMIGLKETDRGLFHDIDGDGLPELVLLYWASVKKDDAAMTCLVTSLYTQSDGKPVALLEKEVLYHSGDAPDGYAGIVTRNGETYFCVHSATGDADALQDTYTLYRISGGKAEPADSVQCVTTYSNDTVKATINGSDASKEDFDQWVSSLQMAAGLGSELFPEKGVALSELSDVLNANSSSFPFNDIPSSFWARTEIAWAHKNNYMNGYSVTTFAPDRTVTRQQLWMVLARMDGTKPSNMSDARRWAMARGVSDGSNPGSPVTRQQMVTMLNRYAAKKGYNTAPGTNTLNSYNDGASIAGYAGDTLNWAISNGLINGTLNGNLNPGSSATRAQFAVILYRFSHNIK